MRALALSLLAVIAALAVPATAAPAPASADGAWRYAEAAVSSDDPLHVGPRHRSAMDALAEEALRERLEEAEVPVYIVMVTQRSNLEEYPAAMVRASGAPGYFFVVGWDGQEVHGGQYGMDDTLVDGLDRAQMAAAVVNGDPEWAEAPTAERLHRLVDLVDSGEAPAAYRNLRDDPGPSGWTLVLGGAGAAGVAVALWSRISRWWRRPIRVVPLTEVVAATVGQAQQDEYRARIAERLTGCGQRVSARGDSSDEVRRALEAYTAAAKVFDSADDKSDLVGVQVLLDMCDAALDGGIRPAHCFFDPRHTSGKAMVRWRAPASFDSVRVLACRECRKAIRAHRTPQPVLDSTGARPLPYYSVLPERSVWAATGYGTLVSDLPARIMRGEHRG